MNDPIDEALLHARVDGALTAAEAAQLEQRLASDTEAASRAARLTALSAALDEVEEEQPPADLIPRVMARVGCSTRGEEDRTEMANDPGRAILVRWPAWHNPGVMTMARKAMIGVAAAAVVVIGIFAYTGFPPVARDTEGSIGAAKRAQAPQMTADSVVLGDAEAQAFMQSDVFDRLLKDEGARKLLADDQFRASLADSNLRGALQSDAMHAALARADIRSALADANMQTALANANVRAALASDAFRASLAKGNLRASFDDAALKAAWADASLQRAMADANVRAALASDALRSAFARADMRAALASDAFRHALADANLSAALASDNLRSAMRATGFASALRASAFAASMRAGMRAE